MRKLSTDAIVFGLGYINGPLMTLEFGGSYAKRKISDRARAALNELVKAGYVDQYEKIGEPGEKYVGVHASQLVGKHLGAVAREQGVNPFAKENCWLAFEKVSK